MFRWFRFLFDVQVLAYTWTAPGHHQTNTGNTFEEHPKNILEQNRKNTRKTPERTEQKHQKNVRKTLDIHQKKHRKRAGKTLEKRRTNTGTKTLEKHWNKIRKTLEKHPKQKKNAGHTPGKNQKSTGTNLENNKN